MARFTKAKKVLLADNTGVRFEFSDGRTIEALIKDLSQEMQERCKVHGVSQKGGDSYSAAESVEEAYDACWATIESLKEGSWSVRGQGESGVTMLVEALFRVTSPEGHTMAQCQEIVDAADDTQIEGLQKLPPVKAALDTIRAERAVERAKKSTAAAATTPFDISSIISK